ncbi:MAG: RNA polymerase sigma factor [Nostocoides sp.]
MTALTAAEVRTLGCDPDVLEAFYRAHVRDIERFVARRVSDPQVVADLTADIFVAIIGAAERYQDSGASPLAWAYGVARHVVAGHHRSAARERTAVSRHGGREVLDPDSYTRLEERIDAERAARDLHERLTALPSGERAVLELVALDGVGLADAGAVLGISPVAARVRVHRARRKLGESPPAPSPRTQHLVPDPVEATS